jgi:hypothetical protein
MPYPEPERYIPIQLRLLANHPALLEGLDTWLKLGLISDRTSTHPSRAKGRSKNCTPRTRRHTSSPYLGCDPPLPRLGESVSPKPDQRS